MEFDQVVKSRRSVRNFTQQNVPDATVNSIISAALNAPSSMNGQPWIFIVIRSPETKKRIANLKDRHCPPEKREFSAQFLTQAPLLIVTCVDRAKSHNRGLENGIIATTYLQLAAASHGLSTVYLSAYTSGTPELEQELRAILGIHDGFDPITLIPVGFPAESPKPKSIRKTAEVIRNETFGGK